MSDRGAVGTIGSVNNCSPLLSDKEGQLGCDTGTCCNWKLNIDQSVRWNDDICRSVLRKHLREIVALGVSGDTYLNSILDQLLSSQPVAIITKEMRDTIKSSPQPQDRMRSLIDHVEAAGFTGFNELCRGLEAMKVIASDTLAHQLKKTYEDELRKQIYVPPSSTQEKKADKTMGQLGHNKSDLNIVFLGRSGAGKTTLINALANYSEFMPKTDEPSNTFAKLFENKLCTLPMKIRISGVDPETRKWCLYDIGGEAELKATPSENVKAGDQVTTKIIDHKIRCRQKTIRLIDTPGFCSEDGTVTTDEKRMREVAQYLNEKCQDLDAVAIVIPASENRLTKEVRQYFRNILEILTREMSANIIVCITYADSGNSETELMVARFVKEITDNEITSEAVHSYENKGIKELTQNIMRDRKQVATKVPTGVEIEALGVKWDSSLATMVKMIDYIATLEKCSTAKLTSISRVREQVRILQEPLQRVIMCIVNNRCELFSAVSEAQKEFLLASSKVKKTNHKERLKRLIRIRKLKFVFRELSTYVTVCRSQKCTKVANLTTERKGLHYVMFHTDTVCHMNCEEHWWTQKCEKLKTGCCEVCTCSYSHHQRTCFAADLKEINEEIPIDGNTIKELNDTLHTEEAHLSIYVVAAAMFSVFLAKFALVHEDATKEFIENNIENARESSRQGDISDDLNLAKVRLKEFEFVQSVYGNYVDMFNSSEEFISVGNIECKIREVSSDNEYGVALKVAQMSIPMARRHAVDHVH